MKIYSGKQHIYEEQYQQSHGVLDGSARNHLSRIDRVQQQNLAVQTEK